MGKTSPSSSGNASANDILNIFAQEFNQAGGYNAAVKQNQAMASKNLNTGSSESPLAQAAQSAQPEAPKVTGEYQGGTLQPAQQSPSPAQQGPQVAQATLNGGIMNGARPTYNTQGPVVAPGMADNLQALISGMAPPQGVTQQPTQAPQPPPSQNSIAGANAGASAGSPQSFPMFGRQLANNATLKRSMNG